MGGLGLIPGLGKSLQKGTTTDSSVFAWRIQWTEEPSRLRGPWNCKELDMTERLSHSPDWNSEDLSFMNLSKK